MTKLCKNCGNATTKMPKNPESYMCNRQLPVNPVDGSPRRLNVSCLTERVSTGHLACGPDGYHYVEKEAGK